MITPTQIVVTPGSTTASSSEAEGDASPAMDSLIEGVAGMTGYFNIQVMTESIMSGVEYFLTGIE